jgi:hypothetical protein
MAVSDERVRPPSLLERMRTGFGRAAEWYRTPCRKGNEGRGETAELCRKSDHASVTE